MCQKDKEKVEGGMAKRQQKKYSMIMEIRNLALCFIYFCFQTSFMLKKGYFSQKLLLMTCSPGIRLGKC